MYCDEYFEDLSGLSVLELIVKGYIYEGRLMFDVIFIGKEFLISMILLELLVDKENIIVLLAINHSFMGIYDIDLVTLALLLLLEAVVNIQRRRKPVKMVKLDLLPVFINLSNDLGD